MSKRKAAVAGVGEEDEPRANVESSKASNKHKRSKLDKAPPCAFLGGGHCTGTDAVLMELNCNGAHHACMSCIHRQFQDNLQFAPDGDSKDPSARVLRTWVTCPECTKNNQPADIAPDKNAMKLPHRHHISLFDDKKDHVCGLCEFTGKLADVYSHADSCVGWRVICPECPKRLPPGGVARHVAECPGQRVNDELEKFASNLSLWLMENGERSPTETYDSMQAILQLVKLLNQRLPSSTPGQIGTLVTKLADKLRSPNVNCCE